MCCPKLQLWEGLFFYFKSTPVFFEWSVREINSLVSKGMSNTYLNGSYWDSYSILQV